MDNEVRARALRIGVGVVGRAARGATGVARDAARVVRNAVRPARYYARVRNC